MKPALFFGAVFIYLIGLFVASTGQAETLTCNSSTIIEVFVDEDCPDCPPPPECPPVLACEAGHECQPIVNGEQQQYPPERAAAWVVSLGCTGLTEVPIDDPRWGDREKGEVYAQEGGNCLSIYWPGDGDALFDISSRVSNPARWNDYLLSGNRPPGSGSYTIGVGKESIRFNDGGSGGMTVFKSIDDIEPPPAGDFLQYYQNPEYEALTEKHRLYPMGGVMPIAYWGYLAESVINRLAQNGFTGYGVDFGNDQTEAKKARAGHAGRSGLRHIVSAYGGSKTPNFTDFCRSGQFDNGPKEQGVVDRVGREVAAYIAEPRWNDYADMWLVTPEETGVRMDHHSKECGRTAAGRFLKNVRLKVNEIDPQNRPIVNTDLSGTNVSQFQFMNRYRESYAAQVYQGGNFKKGGYNGEGWPPAMIGVDVKLGKTAAEGQSFDASVSTTRKQFVFPLIGTYYKLQHVANTVDNWDAYMGYMVSTSMIHGAKGYQIYRWDMPHDGTNADKEASRTGVINFTKKFTSMGFDKAMLWGKRMKGEEYAVGVSYEGPDNANFAGYKSDAFAYTDVQYERCRHLMFSNSHWSDAVHVNLSGLPVGMKMQDMRSGAITALTGSTLSFDLANEGYKAIKIMPVSGECAR